MPLFGNTNVTDIIQYIGLLRNGFVIPPKANTFSGPAGNSEFWFPSTSMFPSASPRGNIESLGETKFTVSLGPVPGASH